MYKSANLSERIAQGLEESIKNGLYKAGEQLPSEMSLATDLGVSRATVREALKILISKHVLEVRRGIGTFVTSLAFDQTQLDERHTINDALKLLTTIHKELIEHIGDIEYKWFTDYAEGLNEQASMQGVLLFFEAMSLQLEKQWLRQILVHIRLTLDHVMFTKNPSFNDRISTHHRLFMQSLRSGEKPQQLMLYQTMIDFWQIEISEDKHGFI